MPKTGSPLVSLLTALFVALWSLMPMLGVTGQADPLPPAGFGQSRLFAAVNPPCNSHHAQTSAQCTKTHVSCEACVAGLLELSGKGKRLGRSPVTSAPSAFLPEQQVAPQIRPPNKDVLV